MNPRTAHFKLNSVMQKYLRFEYKQCQHQLLKVRTTSDAIVPKGGYKCPGCSGRELVGLNTTNAVRHEAEYAQVVQELKHRKQPDSIHFDYRCAAELVGLNTANAVRHEAEYAQVVQELKHRKQPVKRAAPSTTPEES
ncbi:hypothetical protein Tcan_14452 [Toxocara canis]|uniref:Uncharacterized protein n=1 Tax=Toxocara canis TaxID=6265 RepID=A0A0B2VM92_TOXCA|nr:hypothetical protein Tcan_14452 [Toxocara canis]